MELQVTRQSMNRTITVRQIFTYEDLEQLKHSSLLTLSSLASAKALGLLTSRGQPTDLLRSVVATMALGDNYSHTFTFVRNEGPTQLELPKKRTI